MNQPDDGTRARILDAAGAIFAEQGFEKATIREIIAKAQVNLSAVNYHFGDKERLYRATLRRAHEMANEQVPLPEWEPGTPPQVKLRELIQSMVQRMLAVQKLPWQARLMMREFMQPSGAAQEAFEEYVRPHHNILLGVLSELLPPQTPLYRKQQMAFSIVGQCLFYKLSGPIVSVLIPQEEMDKHFQIDQLADHISNVMLAAMGQQSLFDSSEPNPSEPASSRMGSESL